jgi:hypothetical protein
MEIDEKYGKGINLHNILNTLAAYEDSDDEEYLDGALVLIMREKERLAYAKE